MGHFDYETSRPQPQFSILFYIKLFNGLNVILKSLKVETDHPLWDY